MLQSRRHDGKIMSHGLLVKITRNRHEQPVEKRL